MKDKFKILIVDDEESVRSSLSGIIDKFFPGFRVSDTAKDIDDAIKKYIAEQPDIVLLDIEMPGKNGFHFAEKVDISNTSIIFITAYNQYAIKAFKYSATDYLLKPVDISELGNALNRAVSFINTNNISKNLLNSIFNEIEAKRITKLSIPSVETTDFVDVNNILRLEADGSYTKIFLTNKTALTASKNLKEFESLLEEDFFVRVHNSHMVNINYLKKYNKKDGYTVILQDGSKIPVSVRKKDAFESILKRFSR